MATIDIAATISNTVRTQQDTRIGGTTYQTAMNGVGTESVMPSTYLYVSLSNVVVKNFLNNDESFFSFDFSSLPAGTINSASIFLTAAGDQGGPYDGPSPAYFVPYNWGSTIDATDYIAASAVNSMPKYSTMTFSRAAIGTTYSSSATSSFLTDIASGSVIKLALVLKSAVDVGLSGGSPTRDDEIIYNYNYATTAYRPKITVNYTPSAPTGPTYNLIVRPM